MHKKYLKHQSTKSYFVSLDNQTIWTVTCRIKGTHQIAVTIIHKSVAQKVEGYNSNSNLYVPFDLGVRSYCSLSNYQKA